MQENNNETITTITTDVLNRSNSAEIIRTQGQYTQFVQQHNGAQGGDTKHLQMTSDYFGMTQGEKDFHHGRMNKQFPDNIKEAFEIGALDEKSTKTDVLNVGFARLKPEDFVFRSEEPQVLNPLNFSFSEKYASQIEESCQQNQKSPKKSPGSDNFSSKPSTTTGSFSDISSEQKSEKKGSNCSI